MSIQVQVSVRNRKLGVLIRDARLAARKSIKECAEAIGLKGGLFRAYEEGRRAPSLPELEVLAYYLNLPLSHFWSKEVRSDDASPTASLNLPALIGVRQRLIGAMLRQMREQASVSLNQFAELSGFSTSKLRAFELGERPIPLPELEALVALLGGRIESLFDQTGPIGLWMAQQKSVQDFLQLPADLQEFVCKPVNRPYLELAIKLSGMTTDKLRSLAEDLLDITF